MTSFCSAAFWVGLVTLICCPPGTMQISNEEFSSITYEQKLKFDEFRERLIPQVPHDYMREDVYLIRWLRDSYFDVPLAETRLLANLVWRQENRIDTILSEDWSDMDDEYKYTVEGCSREGKPVITVQAGDWDLRRAVVTGKAKRMGRYFDRLYEEATSLLRKMDGNATQFITVLDFNNLNIVTQGCPRCINLLFGLLSTYQDHYPGYTHKVMAINTPQYALPLWEVFRPLLDSNTRAVFSFYGKNSKEWRKSLLEDIDPSQLTKRFGGSRKTPLVDMEDLRSSGLEFKCSFSDNESDYFNQLSS